MIIWVGLGFLLMGIFLLTVVGLIWPDGKARVLDWGWKIGLVLFLMGLALSVVST